MQLAKVQAAQVSGAERRRELIDAAVAAIAEHGLSNVTLAKVAAGAGLTAAMINFHFNSKEALLLATLEHLGEEFDQAVRSAVDGADGDAGAALLALIDVMLDPQVSEPGKVAVWYAFISESRAREGYLRVCGELDRTYYRIFSELFSNLLADRAAATVDTEALAGGLVGLLESQWQELLFERDDYDRAAARRRCRRYLASVCPGRFDMPAPQAPAKTAAAVEPQGPPETLPAWTYDNEEFTALERAHIFLPSWQIVCHVNDVAKPGDYATFELLDERAFVIRGKDGQLRAFHNVCRHRAHAVVMGEQGTCKRAITCPYHGWTYELDGRLKGVPAADTFKPFDHGEYGLKGLDLEVFMGFVFIRFVSGGASVAERLAPYVEELSHYRFEDMAAIDDEMWTEHHPLDWKNAMDNYLEDYHFAIGHPGLSALMERDYDREVLPSGAARLSHRMKDDPQRFWSVREYSKLVPAYDHLPEEQRRRWSYITLFPSVHFDIFPDKMDFFQMLPTGPGQCVLRGRTYALPDERRETRAARYLSLRINVEVQDEDNWLTRSVQGGLRSSAYDVGLLSDKEVAVKGFQDWIWAQLPVARQKIAPPAGTVARRNRELADAKPG
jgi:phenylpropionate dioxygenase-like ring-hydroxylating dioxygenase large terminal subunit/AcrR family transcriptional regulator